jgi:hypothetical protein
MSIEAPLHHWGHRVVTIECRYCDIPFDHLSGRAEAEVLARVHNTLWHVGGAAATVVVLDLDLDLDLEATDHEGAMALAS